MKQERVYKSAYLYVIFILIFLAIVIFPKQLKNTLIDPNQVSIDKREIQNMAVVVPHFDFAKKSRQLFFSQLTLAVQPKKIIVASTNHFGTGSTPIISSNQIWDTQYNDLASEKEINSKLVETGLVSNNHELMISDHGVKNVVGDLSVTYPEAEYLGLLVRPDMDEASLNRISEIINSSCISSQCLFVASVDFSHYGPNSLAQNHDQFSLAALSKLDKEKLRKTESDSVEVLSLLSDFAISKNLKKFSLYENSNSGEVQKDDQIETTSWIIGKFEEGEIEEWKSTTLVIAGDMMLDRMINHEFKDKGFAHIFDNLGNRTFWGSDVSFVNLEGPISKTPIDDNIAVNNLVFNFAPKSVDALKFLKLNSVSLANNHTSNAGSSGFLDTKEILNQNKIGYFGLPVGLNETSIKRYDADFPVSIIAINALENFNEATLKKMIIEEKQNNRFVIVYPHWGSEYLTTNTNAQKQLAHSWIDSGADMIVGSHPHVVENSEIYNGKLIVYSLGNFVFDQTFSKETQTGLVVAIAISNTDITVSYLPIISKNYKPQFAKNEERSSVLELSLPKSGYFQQLRSDTIKLIK